MGYSEENTHSIDDHEESFFDPREYTGNPLPSMRFRPRSAEEAITALQVYMDVLMLLDLNEDDDFDGEYFNIEAVRRKIHDFRNNLNESRNAFLDLKEQGEEIREELRLEKMETESARKETKRVKDALAETNRRLDHLNNQIRLQATLDMMQTIDLPENCRTIEFRPAQIEEDG